MPSFAGRYGARGWPGVRPTPQAANDDFGAVVVALCRDSAHCWWPLPWLVANRQQPFSSAADHTLVPRDEILTRVRIPGLVSMAAEVGPTRTTSSCVDQPRPVPMRPEGSSRARCRRGPTPVAPYSPGKIRPICARIASSVPASSKVWSSDMVALSVSPWARQRCTSSISNRNPFPS